MPRVKSSGQSQEPAPTVRQLLRCEAVTPDPVPREFSRNTRLFLIIHSGIPPDRLFSGRAGRPGIRFPLMPTRSTPSNVTGDQDLENKATFPDQITNFKTLTIPTTSELLGLVKATSGRGTWLDPCVGFVHFDLGAKIWPDSVKGFSNTDLRMKTLHS